MKIFEVERNDFCPCGSGRKFKKCCQERVEDAVRRIGRVIGLGDCTAEGREIVETLGFMYGMRVEEEGRMPDPEFLGRLLQDAWDEEERLRDRGDEVGIKGLLKRFQELLGEKPYLRHLRVPVWQFDFDEDFDIMEYLNRTLGYRLARRSVELIRLSLLYDDCSEDELKLLLTGLSWLVTDEQRELFWWSVLSRTRDDLMAAAGEMSEISGKYRDKDQAGFYAGVAALFDKYPVYKKMLSESLTEEIEPAVTAVMQGKIKLDVPLYSVLGGIYATISGLVESLEDLLSRRRVPPVLLPLLEEALLDAGGYEFFLPEVVNSLSERMDEVQDGDLKESLGKLMLYLSFMYDDNRYALLEYLYLRHACIFLVGLPLVLQEAGVEFKDVKDLCDENLVEKYAAYLESRNLVEEAGYVRDVYRSFGAQAREKAADGQKDLVSIARSLVEEETRTSHSI
ncbi:MAG TPA: SEC-C domain-containing protein [Syntrophomonadaceae bacterium]|nr:SEC-C domain-containing protein [Syntrophomonadaceae bacterium]